MCGNLCSATAVLHGQLSGRMFSIRHVRSNSGERVSVGPSVSSLGLNVVAWALRRHVPHSIFDGWESMCSAPKAVYTGCEVVWGGGVIALLTHRSPLNTKGDYAIDRKIRNLGSGELLSELATSTSQRWENPCWWGHALTKGQSDLGVIEWGQRGGRRWPHRVQMSSPLQFCVGVRHH